MYDTSKKINLLSYNQCYGMWDYIQKNLKQRTCSLGKFRREWSDWDIFENILEMWTKIPYDKSAKCIMSRDFVVEFCDTDSKELAFALYLHTDLEKYKIYLSFKWGFQDNNPKNYFITKDQT